MISFGAGRRALFVVWASVAGAFWGSATARASVIEVSPELPLLDVPYVTSGSGSCFPAVGLCISNGAFTLTSVTSNKIVGGSELITTDATYTADLTKDNSSKTPEGTLTLTGTIEQKVVGRVGLFEYPGAWTVDLLSMSMTGSVDGGTLTLGLNTAMPSSGTTSITPFITNQQYFDISSTFDVNVALSLTIPGKPKLSTTRSGTATATTLPEPATVAILGTSLLALSAVRRRRR
jgi:hypothetical protein